MELAGDSKLLRIFIGEIDKIGHQPLYETILLMAKNKGWQDTRVHTARFINISEDLPIIIEIVWIHEEKAQGTGKTGSAIRRRKVENISAFNRKLLFTLNLVP